VAALAMPAGAEQLAGDRPDREIMPIRPTKTEM
jgi:hypothetical protein